MTYAYVKNGVVLEVERRTEQYPDDPFPIARFYHASLTPFFIPIPEELKDKVRKGWAYSHDAGFHEPEPFEINPETGEMYLPAGIPADSFWEVYQDNMRLTNELITAQQDITDRELDTIELNQRVAELESIILGGGSDA